MWLQYSTNMLGPAARSESIPLLLCTHVKGWLPNHSAMGFGSYSVIIRFEYLFPFFTIPLSGENNPVLSPHGYNKLSLYSHICFRSSLFKEESKKFYDATRWPRVYQYDQEEEQDLASVKGITLSTLSKNLEVMQCFYIRTTEMLQPLLIAYMFSKKLILIFNFDTSF